jgi:hypothetical protein
MLGEYYHDFASHITDSSSFGGDAPAQQLYVHEAIYDASIRAASTHVYTDLSMRQLLLA